MRCRNCDTAFEPFDALVSLSRGWVHYAANRSALARECAELREQRDKLLQERDSLRASVRRLKKQSPNG